MDCCIGSNEEDGREILENPDPVEAMKRKRTCTDKGFFFAMAVFFLILFGFLGFCITNGDLDRIFNGYDNCGNVCGKNNIKTASMSYFKCYGKNMENKKFLLYKNFGIEVYNSTVINVTKICVEKCEDHDAYVDFFNRCYPNSSDKQNITVNNFFQELFEDFQICWRNIILLSFLAIVLSVILMVLMRYATAFFVWFVLASVAIECVGLAGVFLVLWKNAKDDNYNNQVWFSYAATMILLFTAGFLILVFVLAKRIKLVIQLFKEGAKVIAAIPLLLLQPVVTFLFICFILSIYIYMTMWIISSGYLARSLNDSFDYVLFMVQIFTNWYNLMAVLWIIQFVYGCQHMIIAGSVATWYFARNKENLGTPIITSTRNLVRYHLGTVAVGSLFIAIIQNIRLTIFYLRLVNRRGRYSAYALLMCLCDPFLRLIEDFIKYYTKNSYIIAAIHGYSFCESGKRAANLLVRNIFSVFAVNSVGDCVLFFTKLIVVIFTVCVGTEVFRQYDEINHFWFPLTCVGIVSYLIAHCFVTVFEMAVDTIFLCFCEDCEANDGDTKPFFMSRNLMEFIENTNSKKWNEIQQEAWNVGPKRIMLQEAQSAS